MSSPPINLASCTTAEKLAWAGRFDSAEENEMHSACQRSAAIRSGRPCGWRMKGDSEFRTDGRSFRRAIMAGRPRVPKPAARSIGEKRRPTSRSISPGGGQRWVRTGTFQATFPSKCRPDRAQASTYLILIFLAPSSFASTCVRRVFISYSRLTPFASCLHFSLSVLSFFCFFHFPCVHEGEGRGVKRVE